MKDLYNKHPYQNAIKQMMLVVTFMALILMGLNLYGIEGTEKAMIFSLVMLFILNVGGMLTADKKKVESLRNVSKKTKE